MCEFRIKQAVLVAMLSGIALLTGCSNERRMTVTATAFNSTKAQTDGRPTETSCGNKLASGSKVIAVSRDLKKQGMACGTEVEIDGLEGMWTVADVTAARHENLIDIYMGRDIKAARRWGIQEVEIKWRPADPQRRNTRVASR